MVTLTREGRQLVAALHRRCRCCNQPVRDLRVNQGLCDSCHSDPVTKKKFSSVVGGALVRTGTNWTNDSGRPLDDRPTSAIPGSPGKLKVLIERAERGCHLWHPDDACMPGVMDLR